MCVEDVFDEPDDPCKGVFDQELAQAHEVVDGWFDEVFEAWYARQDDDGEEGSKDADENSRHVCSIK